MGFESGSCRRRPIQDLSLRASVGDVVVERCLHRRDLNAQTA
jgi:hypothetical protein